MTAHMSELDREIEVVRRLVDRDAPQLTGLVEQLIKAIQAARYKAEKCQNCQERPAIALHTCPFKEEIKNDTSSTCNCCDECRNECAMDV